MCTNGAERPSVSFALPRVLAARCRKVLGVLQRYADLSAHCAFQPRARAPKGLEKMICASSTSVNSPIASSTSLRSAPLAICGHALMQRACVCACACVRVPPRVTVCACVVQVLPDALRCVQEVKQVQGSVQERLEVLGTHARTYTHTHTHTHTHIRTHTHGMWTRLFLFFLW